MGTAAIVVYACLAGAVAIGCLASLSLSPGVRNWRLLSLLATFALGVASLFVATWYVAIGAWIGIGVVIGLAFAIYEFLAEREAAPEEREGFHASHVLFGLFVWPLMTMDLFENLFAPTPAPIEDVPSSDDAS